MRARDILASHGELLAGAEGGVQCLRDLVIDFGMQGLLVEQDSSDAPAEASLCAAREAAPARDKSWKLVEPTLDSKDRNDCLPTGWALASINDCGRFINGIGFKKAEWKSDGLPIIRIQNLTDESKPFNYAQGDYPEDHLVEDGDLLVSWSASLDAFVWRRGPAVVNQHIFKVVPFRELVEPRFLYWLLRRTIRQMVRGEHMRGMGMKHIKRGPFLSHAVAIPPLKEQARIVSKVDELMTLCDELEEKQQHRHTVRRRFQTSALDVLANAESAEELAESWKRVRDNWDAVTERGDDLGPIRDTLMQLAVRGRLTAQSPQENVTGDLVPPEADIAVPDWLPSNWRVARLDEVALVTGGITKGRKLEGRELVSIPYLRVANVQAGSLQLGVMKEIEIPVEEVEKYRLEAGDVLLTEGGDWDKLGRSAIWRDELPLCGHQNHVFRARPHQHLVTPEWLSLFTNSPDGRSYFQTCAKRTTNLASINMRQLRACAVPIPPLSEQVRVREELDRLFILCDELEQHLSRQERLSSRLAESAVHSLTT
ncbi:MAG: restriction endonuclease subunit S [Planctomycetota bacterium]